jgi:mycothiol synthase
MARERELYGHAFSGGGDLRASRPRFEPETDAWVVTSPDDSVVAYGEVWEREPGRLMEAQAVVDPGHTGQGFGALLLDLTEGRARERTAGASIRLRNVAPAEDQRAAHLLIESDYGKVRRFQHMAIDLGSATSSPAPGSEGTVRSFEVARDAETVHAILQAAFEGTWEFTTTTFERWRETSIDAPTFDEGLWFVAELNGEAAGAVLALDRPAGGWIIDIGVIPKHRGRGVGAELMKRVFDAFRERGTMLVELNVDAENPTGAPRLYERLGMTVTRSWDLYDKSLG